MWGSVHVAQVARVVAHSHRAHHFVVEIRDKQLVARRVVAHAHSIDAESFSPALMSVCSGMRRTSCRREADESGRTGAAAGGDLSVSLRHKRHVTLTTKLLKRTKYVLKTSWQNTKYVWQNTKHVLTIMLYNCNTRRNNIGFAYRHAFYVVQYNTEEYCRQVYLYIKQCIWNKLINSTVNCVLYCTCRGAARICVKGGANHFQ